MATGFNYQGRDGELRLLDKSQSTAGLSGTPWGYKVPFEQMDFQMTFAKRPENLVRLDRQRISDDAHLQIGSEEPLYQGVQCSFSMVMSSLETDAVLQFIGVDWSQLEGASTSNPAWTVKGTPNIAQTRFPQAGLVSTKARSKTAGDGLYTGGRVDSKGSLVQLQAFADRKGVTVDVEVLFQERDTSNRFGYRLKEVQFEPGSQQVSESADFIMVKLTGMVYGEAQRITSASRYNNVLDLSTHLT